jgi:hypothetical protein
MESQTSTLIFENKFPKLERNTLTTVVFQNEFPEKEYNALTSAVVENKIPNLNQIAISTASQYSINAKTFHISALGIPLIRLPHPPKILVTHIYASDGSTAYTSTRAKRCSGSCILSSPDRGDLISTIYRFGPGRPPRLRYVETPKHADDQEMKFQGKMLAFSQTFPTPAGDVLEWRYVKETLGDDKKRTEILVLTDVSDGWRIARLLRTDGTRTEGSKKCSAGNGGLLIIEESAEGKMVDEALIIATCLVMLKKEMDRRMHMQAAVLTALIH